MQSKEFFEALEELSIEKGINKDYLLDAIETALLTAYKKNFNAEENVKIIIDEEKAVIQVFSLREVVEEVVIDSKYPTVLAVTACPTGIAHTYMAAEGLENAGKETGHLIKVETQGQSGAKNILTEGKRILGAGSCPDR